MKRVRFDGRHLPRNTTLERRGINLEMVVAIAKKKRKKKEREMRERSSEKKSERMIEGVKRRGCVKEAAPSDFHTNSRADGNHSEIKVIHHPRYSFYSAIPT